MPKLNQEATSLEKYMAGEPIEKGVPRFFYPRSYTPEKEKNRQNVQDLNKEFQETAGSNRQKQLHGQTKSLP